EYVVARIELAFPTLESFVASRPMSYWPCTVMISDATWARPPIWTGPETFNEPCTVCEPKNAFGPRVAAVPAIAVGGIAPPASFEAATEPSASFAEVTLESGSLVDVTPEDATATCTSFPDVITCTDVSCGFKLAIPPGTDPSELPSGKISFPPALSFR